MIKTPIEIYREIVTGFTVSGEMHDTLHEKIEPLILKAIESYHAQFPQQDKADVDKLPLEWSPVESEKEWQKEQMRKVFPNYENDQPDWQRLNFFLNLGTDFIEDNSDKAAHTVSAWVEIECGKRMPIKEAHYFCLPQRKGFAYSDGHFWYWDENGKHKTFPTHWLEQVQLPIQGYSLEQVENAFDAGMEHEYEKHYGAIPPTSPNKEQYIKSLK